MHWVGAGLSSFGTGPWIADRAMRRGPAQTPCSSPTLALGPMHRTLSTVYSAS